MEDKSEMNRALLGAAMAYFKKLLGHHENYLFVYQVQFRISEPPQYETLLTICTLSSRSEYYTGQEIRSVVL
jgi:hypothetical protein